MCLRSQSIARQSKSFELHRSRKDLQKIEIRVEFAQTAREPFPESTEE